jgi:NAD-dependent deacetylase
VCLEQAGAWIEEASTIAVLTGAGISAESGIPTFRGAGASSLESRTTARKQPVPSLWKNFRPEDLATPDAFARDPNTVWEWYDWRRALIHEAQPNPGHLALAELERRTARCTLITQNVDGLHQRAGSRNVLEVHGSIWNLRCTRCRRTWRDASVPLNIPPRCECGALARPGVVWFGEMLPEEIWWSAEQAAASCDVFLVVGTSAVVYPAAGLIPLARASGAKVVEVNTARTAASSGVDCVLTGPAGEILPQVLSQQSRA